MMEERINQLEAEAFRRGLDPRGSPQSRESTEQTSPLGLQDTEQAVSHSASHSTDKTAMNMGSLSLSAMAEPPSRAGEFLEDLSMPSIITSVTEIYGGNPEESTRSDPLWDGIAKHVRNPTEILTRLDIQRSEASKCLDTYMDSVDFRYPRIPIEKVRSGIDAITDPDPMRYEETLREKPAHIFMAYMVIAIVSLVSENRPAAQGSFVSIHILAKCLKVLNRVFSLEDGVDIIQCLHLLVVFSMHSSAAGSAWHLIGFAMTKCIALGYHQEPSILFNDDGHLNEDLQQRRWAFWSCYLLDRLICGALDRPFSISDLYVTVALPEQARNLPASVQQNESMYIHLFRYSTVYSFITSDERAEDFNDALGQVLGWMESSSIQRHASLQVPYGYHRSLYNTLVLRVVMQQIPRPYGVKESEIGTGSTGPMHESGEAIVVGQANVRLHAQERVAKTKLLQSCHLVAQSLNRPSMARRHFLSLVTGYSAISMALGALYYLAVMDTNQHNEPSLRLADEILDTAFHKLDIAGRQFPRMQHYRQAMHSILEFMRISRSVPVDPVERDEKLENWKSFSIDIGPCYLRKVAKAVYFFLK
jgi:hypothetical protein